MRKPIIIFLMAIFLINVTACGQENNENAKEQSSIEDSNTTEGETEMETKTETEIEKETQIETEIETEQEEEAMVHKITPEEAYNKMNSGETVIILDVRTTDEYAEGHISNAIVVPNETIISEMPEELPDLDAQILVYCRSGRRSAEAAQKLVDMGYTNIYDFGGIIDWPYDVVK